MSLKSLPMQPSALIINFTKKLIYEAGVLQFVMMLMLHTSLSSKTKAQNIYCILTNNFEGASDVRRS